jgi:hypothetical protein
MVILDGGIKIFIESEGHVLEEYNDPDQSNDDNEPIVRYIESTPGARFQAGVSVDPGFNFHGATDLVLYVTVDGGARRRDSIMKSDRLGISTRPVTCKQSYCPSFDQQAQKWFKGIYSFATVSTRK